MDVKTSFFIIASAPEGVQRRPRVRTPKAEKVNADEVGGVKEKRARGRKRNKSLQANEAAGVSGEAGSLTQEVDPITAAIEAVLANISAISAEKPKKRRRTKKQEQEGNTGTAPKPDAEMTVDENDDDSSTAGNEAGLYSCFPR